jgi:AmmeMemoRadiSam system protein B
MYSGQVAAHAYKQIEGEQYDSVVVFAPSHRAYFSGASVDRKSGYRTPLGIVPIDTALAGELADGCPLVSFHEEAHAQEHSLEVQLPFLQKVIPTFSLVPIIMGDQDVETCETIANAVAEVIQGRKTLAVASSDLSHYHPYDQARDLDQKVIDFIDAFDPHGLASDLGKHRIEACGGGPIITALLLAKRRGAIKAKVVKYANSGDISGDYSGVVGYAAGVIY